MANFKISDSILKHLYAHYYESTIEALSSALKVDRAAVTENIEALSKEGAIKREGTSVVKLTRLGVYYLESKAYVTRAQILANELNQFAVLRFASEPDKPPVNRDGVLEDVSSPAAIANADMLASGGMLTPNGDGTYSITDDGLKQLNYFRSRFDPASLEAAAAAKPTRVRVTTSRAKAGVASPTAAEEPVPVEA